MINTSRIGTADRPFTSRWASGAPVTSAEHFADSHAAMLPARTAILGADQADHKGLRARLPGLQSLVAYWAGRYAEMGTAFANEGGGTTSVWLSVSTARAYAALDHSERARCDPRRRRRLGQR